MISQYEYEDTDRKEKQWDKEVEGKEETVHKSVFIHLTKH